MKMTVFAFAALALMLSTFTAANADPLGSAVVAKTRGDAIIIWQATPEVASLVANAVPTQKAIWTLQADALRIVLSKRASLAHANSVTVNVIYARTAGVSPVYKADTFGGFEKLMVVQATHAALGQTGRWLLQIDKGEIPPGVTMTVSGNLPPH